MIGDAEKNFRAYLTRVDAFEDDGVTERSVCVDVSDSLEKAKKELTKRFDAVERVEEGFWIKETSGLYRNHRTGYRVSLWSKNEDGENWTVHFGGVGVSGFKFPGAAMGYADYHYKEKGGSK